MKIEMRPIGSITPYEGNPRVNAQAVDAVAASLRQFGWRQPIVVDESGVVIAGHTRLLAARKLGMTEVPVHVATDLTPAQVKAYRLADNKVSELAEWDLDLLSLELKDLQGMDYSLEGLGFDVTELAELLPGEAPLTDPDEVPLPPITPVTESGDLWLLGDHRLMCADSSKPEDVDRLLDGARIQLVNTDPPYNVKVEPRSNNAIAAGNSSFTNTHHQSLDLARHPGKAKPTGRMRAKDRPLANDFVSPEAFEAMLLAWFGNMARALEPGGGFYIWGGYANCANYPPALKASELYFAQAVIWVKEHPVLTRKDFMGNHEWCFYGWREGAAHRFYGPANVTDTWSVKKVNPQAMVHLTEKPVELASRAIEYSSRPLENVLDLFGGSGSTLIAAHLARRRAFLMELDQAYCDVIVQRFWNLTKIEPRLVRGGKEVPWTQVADGFATAGAAGGASSSSQGPMIPKSSASVADGESRADA